MPGLCPRRNCVQGSSDWSTQSTNKQICGDKSEQQGTSCFCTGSTAECKTETSITENAYQKYTSVRAQQKIHFIYDRRRDLPSGMSNVRVWENWGRRDLTKAKARIYCAAPSQDSIPNRAVVILLSTSWKFASFRNIQYREILNENVNEHFTSFVFNVTTKFIYLFISILEYLICLILDIRISNMFKVEQNNFS